MQETSSISEILQATTSAGLINTQTEDNSPFEATKFLLFEKYQSQYPDAEIDENFLFDIRRVEKEVNICSNCKGYPCKMPKFRKGQKTAVIQKGNNLFLYTGYCEYYKAAQMQSVANKQFKTAKIPEMYVGKTFADYKVDADNQNAVDWAKEFESMYLCGNSGAGKTFLAAIMAQELLKQGKSVIFGDVPTLLDRLKGTFDDNSSSTLEELMQTLSEVDVLVLDDLGAETPTDWAVERLYLIINNRYNAKKMLIVTSNFTPDIVERRLNNPKTKNRNFDENVTGSRIVSRIKQMCRMVYLSGKDRRLRR